MGSAEIQDEFDELKNEIEQLRELFELERKDNIDLRHHFAMANEQIELLREALRSLIAACDSGKHVPISGTSGMTHEAMIKNEVINRVPAWPVEEARAALKEGE